MMKKRISLAFSALVFFTAETSMAAEYFVATNGSDANSGTDWSAPLLTISNAVAKSDATIVTVSNGTYNIGAQIVVGGAITVRSYGGGVYGGLANASNTVVQGPGGSTTGPRIFSVTNAVAVLDGFTIRNGCGRGDSGWNGNGVYMANGCTVMNCIIKENGGATGYDHAKGGGVYMASGLLSNCIVRANKVNAGSQAGGGGIWAEGGQIVNCQVVANQNVAGAFNGGGIYANNTQIINCQILSNTNSATSGGGIAATSASTLIRNCLIASNRTSAASTYGGGVYGGRIESSTIAGNSAANATGTYGGGVYGSVVTNSIVVNNTTGLGSNPNYDPTSTFAYSCASPKPAGAGNIDTVAFVNAPAGDYRLVASPAVDSGTNLAWMGGALDLGGNPRTNGANNRVDMGAYELVPGALQCGLAADVQSVVAPSNVVFTAYLAGTNRTITSYNWDFGDGQTANGATLSSVTNTYSSAGLYTVTLSVNNDTGESTSATNTGYITVFGSDLYVWTNSPAPAAPYHTWANAARSLYVAVSAAPAGSRVVVTNGTYNLGAQILVDKAITVCGFGGGVYGGLANASNTVVQRDTALANTVTFRVFAVTNAGAVLDGLTIRNGLGRGDGVPAVGNCDGNGLYLVNGIVRNCIIKENGVQASGDTSHVQGGGVCMASGTLSNCLVVANKPTVNATGGGIWADGGQILNCTVISNSCPGSGGGVVANSASVLIRNCLIVSNQVSGASTYGGGVYGGRIESSTIVGNSAANASGTSGGGVYGSVVTNSIVWNNTTGSGTGTNYGGTCTFGYTCTAPLPAGSGNISSDPLFVNPGAGNYRLASKPPASPCNDKGTNLVWMAAGTDLDGNLRIQHNIVDMGAYESVFIPAGTIITFF